MDMGIPRNEYPRPQMRREGWINLNGTWEFAFDFGRTGKERGMQNAPKLDREILVPFCPESVLSGIHYLDFMNAVWYRRSFKLDELSNGNRVLLHFEAVDHFSTVYLNGTELGSHTGGFTPFSFDITGQVRPGENVLTVCAEDDSRERESILSIYSALFTYHSDTEKNNDILKNALQTSRRLGQLLSNMQDGMRSYFEELSQKKNFIGIQKVLVEEINNRDSKKYAILTTTDSFYRYKEAVKELISQILRENDQKREQLVKERTGLVEGTVTSKRNQYRLEYCESASQLVYQVEREFDLIEKKYNKLIEQKTVFAKRALARIHYILQEGSSDEDHIVKLINLLDHHANSPQVLEQMRDRIRVGTQFKNITDRSFYNRKNAEDAGFHPIAMEKHNEETQMTDFVPKPLYTKKQLQEFRQKNIVDGRFVTDEQTIQSVEDLEKLLFLWQEETDDTKQEETVHIDGELKGEYGFVFSKLVIDAKKGEKK